MAFFALLLSLVGANRIYAIWEKPLPNRFLTQLEQCIGEPDEIHTVYSGPDHQSTWRIWSLARRFDVETFSVGRLEEDRTMRLHLTVRRVPLPLKPQPVPALR